MNPTPSPRCAIVLPVYNEERILVQTLDRLKAMAARVPGVSFEIICVNDGSKDGSAAILDNYEGITVLTHVVNRGYGAALKSAIDYCDQEWIFIVDSDGTYPIEDFPRLWESVCAQTDMVVGARQGIGITRNPLRQFARWTLRKMVQALTGVMVPDLNSGMRLFKKSLYEEFCHLLPKGFSFTSTITVASLYGGHVVKYVPIEYGDRVGASNIRPVSDFFGFTMLIIRLASYFEPLRFFLPLSVAVAVLGILRTVRDILVVDSIGSLAVILYVVALNIFTAGIVIDVVVRRTMQIASRTRPGAIRRGMGL